MIILGMEGEFDAVRRSLGRVVPLGGVETEP